MAHKKPDMVAGFGVCVITLPGISAALCFQKYMEAGITLSLFLGLGVVATTFGLCDLVIESDEEKRRRKARE